MHPPAGAWLYFELVDKDGTEAFADTYAQQLANEQVAKSRGLGSVSYTHLDVYKRQDHDRRRGRRRVRGL